VERQPRGALWVVCLPASNWPSIQMFTCILTHMRCEYLVSLVGVDFARWFDRLPVLLQRTRQGLSIEFMSGMATCTQ
jgi:hypothetical protein